MSTELKKRKNYCDNCKNETNHVVLFVKNNPSIDPEYHYEKKYMVLECMGCERISFREEAHDYETSYPDEYDNWIHDITVKIYPEPLKNHRHIIEEYLLPSQIKTVYKETIEAIKSDCHLLAGVGFRAVIEAICIDKAIQGRFLETKIDNLAKNRFITEKDAERLHAVRFMGNDSVHEMAVPKENALYVVLQIIENLLHSLYIIDHKAKPVLDTYITTLADFEDLLFRKLKKYKKGDDYPLAKYLEKDIRRLNNELSKFEADLINEIKSGNCKYLKIGDIKPFGAESPKNLQHFIIT